MCGIAGYAGLNTSFVKDGAKKLEAMSKLIAHRGPYGFGV